MLKTSVQSGHLIFDDKVDEGFRMLKEAGFEAVDYNIDERLPGGLIRNGELNDFFNKSVEELREYYRPHKEAAAKYGIEFGQMHAPFPSMKPEDARVNDYLIMVFEKCLDVCEFLSCPYLIVHPANLIFDYGAQTEWDWNIEMYRRLIPAAKRTGVKICLENMFTSARQHITEAVCSDFAEAARYIDTLNEMAGQECFAFCFDVGHANLLGKNMYKAVTTLGSRLQTLHIHDNDGIGDLHLMPYTYARCWGADIVTDWDGLLRGLHDIGYRGSMNLETYRVMDIFPQALRPAALKMLHEISAYMAGEVQGK